MSPNGGSGRYDTLTGCYQAGVPGFPEMRRQGHDEDAAHLQRHRAALDTALTNS